MDSTPPPAPLLDRLPPHNRDAERSVLGGILRDPETLHDALRVITPEAFYFDHHQRLFRAFRDLSHEGKRIDLVTIYERFRDTHELANLGGRDAIVELWDTSPTGANVEYHAGIVRDCAIVRALIHTANEILRDAYDRVGSAEQMVDSAERKLFDLSERLSTGRESTVLLADLVKAALARIDDRVSGNVKPGLVTGMPDLDDLLGELRGGQMIVVGARPGCGKTAFAAAVSSNIAAQGTPTLFFSMEMPAEQIGERILAMGSGVALNRINRGREFYGQDAMALNSVLSPGGLGTVPIWVDDTPGQSATRLMATARREIRRRGIGLIVVDYLQLMRPENPNENRTQQVGLMSRRMKQMARECNVPVVCLCQLNRQIENRGADAKPRLADIRESGDIEADADVVLLLHPQPNQPKDRDAWLIDVGIAKQRNGPVGDVTLTYRRPCVRFETRTR